MKTGLKGKKPELLVGTGNFASAIAAVKNGADAVYLESKALTCETLEQISKQVN